MHDQFAPGLAENLADIFREVENGGCLLKLLDSHMVGIDSSVYFLINHELLLVLYFLGDAILADIAPALASQAVCAFETKLHRRYA
jgi:hypothetical protein